MINAFFELPRLFQTLLYSDGRRQHTTLTSVLNTLFCTSNRPVVPCGDVSANVFHCPRYTMVELARRVMSRRRVCIHLHELLRTLAENLATPEELSTLRIVRLFFHCYID